MKRALFKSVNLIGDAMYISPALRAWHGQHPDYEIDLLTLNDHVTRLYSGMGVPVNVITTYEEVEVPYYDFLHTFDVNQAFQLSDQKKQHVAESYADLLGVELDRKPDMSHVGPFYQPPNDLTTPDEDLHLILVSMFSASCSSRGNPPGPANKSLPIHKWKPILRSIVKQFPETKIKFLGAPTDCVPQELLALVPNGEPLLGIPLDRLALVMRTCKFLVTLDSGMAHLASSQKTREFVFYPSCLGTHYILPSGNENMRYLHMDPLTLNPAEAIWRLQEAWKSWGL